MDKEAELKDHESLSRSARDRRKWAGRREGIIDEGIEGQGICGGENDQTEERPGVSQIVLGVSPGLGTYLLSKEWPCLSSCWQSCHA